MVYDFFKKLTKILDKGQSRSVVLSGNVYDLFDDGTRHTTLTDFLAKKCQKDATENKRGITVVLYEVNRPVRIIGDQEAIRQAWNNYKGVTETNNEDDLLKLLRKTQENPTLAVEILRQLTIVARQTKSLKTNLFIIIEAADMLMPIGEYSRLSVADRRRISVFHDWFSDQGFVGGNDSVVLLTESRSQLHPHVAKLPQVLEVQVPIPDKSQRWHFINNHPMTGAIKVVKGYEHHNTVADNLAGPTAALTLQAIQQLLYEDDISPEAVNNKVAEHILAQLGEDTVEFHRPLHRFADVRGFTDIKKFLQTKIIPRILGGPEGALAGAAIAGPIGGGKTFLMLALASELGIPVLILKNLRSQWFGQTDVILERLRRMLEALDRVMIFIDEADTQFGGVGADAHETERRLTGKIQAMMSDPALKGKVFWLLMTARINMLSPDIRRPGRAGDLIIPILDPEGDDRDDFIYWVFGDICNGHVDSVMEKLQQVTANYSAASFAALRSELKAENCKTLDEALAIAADMISPDIEDTRQYQILQAVLNCTRKSLIPQKYFKDGKSIEALRKQWKLEVAQLEAKGIR